MAYRSRDGKNDKEIVSSPSWTGQQEDPNAEKVANVGF